MSTVTVPADKLLELQRKSRHIDEMAKTVNTKLAEIQQKAEMLEYKAKLVGELVKVLEEVDEAFYCASEWEVPIMLPTRVKEAIAKAKGE